ncbi:MAG: hypothetical protein R2713_11220 [Ilumatobacteraceae bacterium]
MIAVNQRVLELENRLLELDERLTELQERLGKVDENALEEVKAEMSRAVGEATLVRIELDRVVANVDEKIDRQTIRMAEIEGLLSDQMDVSTAVQLERLDELERQMQYLDPAQFVKVTDHGGGGPRRPRWRGDLLRAGPDGTQPALAGADTGQDPLTADPNLTSH